MNNDQNNYLLIGVASSVIAGFLIVNMVIGALTAWIWWATLVALLALALYAFWMLTRGNSTSLVMVATHDEGVATSTVAEPSVEPTPAEAVTETPQEVVETHPTSLEKDDLKVIRGIGPKMEAALHGAGITTYTLLSQQTEESLLEIIQASGMRLAPTIGTWMEQADYAARGDFDGLKSLQEKLSAD